MAKNINPNPQTKKFNVVWFILAALFTVPTHAYVDQLWLQSPKVIKTVYDVKVFSIFRNLHVNQVVIDPNDETWMKAHIKAERIAFLEQTIVNQYIHDNRVSISIQDEDITKIKENILSGFESKEEQKKTFEKWSLTSEDLLKWIEERLLLERFLQTHPPFQAIVTDQKIRQYYESHKEERFLNQKLESIRELVVKDYQTNYLKVEFKRWVDQEVRRQKWDIYE